MNVALVLNGNSVVRSFDVYRGTIAIDMADTVPNDSENDVRNPPILNLKTAELLNELAKRSERARQLTGG